METQAFENPLAGKTILFMAGRPRLRGQKAWRIRIMKLSTRGRYGTRAMVELASHPGEGFVKLDEVARHQQISRRYLEHIFADLKAAGLIRGSRGPQGGYALTRAPANISVSEILEAVEGPLAITDCLLSDDYCERAPDCPTRQLWIEVTEAIAGILDSRTLADLLQWQGRQRRKLISFQI